jgi:hypothetical protein
VREQQNKDGTCNKTNVHHDLLCFSLERGEEQRKDKGFPFALCSAKKRITPENTPKLFCKKRHIDNGTSDSACERLSRQVSEIYTKHFVVVNEKFRRRTFRSPP